MVYPAPMSGKTNWSDRELCAKNAKKNMIVLGALGNLSGYS